MTLLLQVNNAIAATAARGVDIGLTITLHAGDIGVVSGPPQSGKSALLRAILGLEKLRAGDIEIFGVRLNRAGSSQIRHVRQKIGVVSQSDGLLEKHTVFDNVALPLRISGIAETQIHQRVTAQLTELGLLQKSRHPVTQLALEERRQVSFAQAAVKYPPLVLADLRPDPFDSFILRPALLRQAALGSAVLIFERQERPDGLLNFERKISLRESLLVA